MRLSILLMALSLPVYACPDLSGEFTCTIDDTTESIVISQQAGQTLKLTVNETEIDVDGKNYSMDGDPTLRNGNMRSWCDGNVIKSQVTGDFYDGETKTGELDSTTQYSITDDNFVTTTSGKIKNGAGNTALDDKFACTRVKSSY